LSVKGYRLSKHATMSLSQREIDEKWVRMCLEDPQRIEKDKADSAVKHYLKEIPSSDNRVLKVVAKPDETDSGAEFLVITAFFERKLKGKL